MKRCTKCKVEKPLSGFHKDRGAKDGLQSWCKECTRKWREENRERARENTRKWREKHPGYHHRRRYGEELEEKERRYREQDGKCGVCGGELGEWWAAQQDHDHITNENRGLLCVGCNVGLGFFEGKALLFAAYLRKYGKVVEVKIEPSDA